MVTTNLADTFNTFRTNSNTISTNLGDITVLTTTDKTSTVSAINELDSDIGILTSLTTTANGSVILAINEIDGNLGDLSTLTTTANGNLVAAINEIDGGVGDLSTLTTTANSDLVSAINEIDATTTSVTLDSITGGPLTIANGGTGVNSLGDIVASSSKITVTNGSASIVGPNIGIDIVPSSILLTELGGTLSVGKGGTGRTALDNIVQSVSGVVTVSNGSNAIIGGDVTLGFDETKVVTLSSVSSITASTAIITTLTVSGAGSFDSTTPIANPNVTVAAIEGSASTTLTTREYVDEKVGLSTHADIVEVDWIQAPGIGNKSTQYYKIPHGNGSTPEFVMPFLRGSISTRNTSSVDRSSSVIICPMLDTITKKISPGYVNYDSTHIYSSVRLQDDGSGSTYYYGQGLVSSSTNNNGRPVAGGDYKFTMVNTVADYDSTWVAISPQTDTNFNHALAEFPSLVTLEGSDGDGGGTPQTYIIPKMGTLQHNGTKWNQLSITSLNTTDCVISNDVVGSKNLWEFTDNTKTTISPDAGFLRLRCWKYSTFTPDYDSNWVSIDGTAPLRFQILRHGFNKIPSLIMLYLAEDDDGAAGTINGTNQTPGGAVVLAMQHNQTEDNSSVTQITHMSKDYIQIVCGESAIFKYRTSDQVTHTITSGVYRVMCWK